MRVIAPMDYKDHVAIIELVDNAAQLHIVIAWSKLTVIFVLPIAQLALLAAIVEHAGNDGQVVEQLQLVERVADVLTIVVHLILFKERLVFLLKDLVFVIVTISTVDVDGRTALDDRPEQLEDLLFHAAAGCIFAQYQQARLGNWLLSFPHHVA